MFVHIPKERASFGEPEAQAGQTAIPSDELDTAGNLPAGFQGQVKVAHALIANLHKAPGGTCHALLSRIWPSTCRAYGRKVVYSGQQSLQFELLVDRDTLGEGFVDRNAQILRQNGEFYAP